VNAQPTKFDLVIKPDYREGARLHYSADAACPRRRGDRIEIPSAAVHWDAIGTKRTCHDIRLMSAMRTKADIDQTVLIYRDFMSTRPRRHSYRRVAKTGSSQ
jgi:hypothetical protein